MDLNIIVIEETNKHLFQNAVNSRLGNGYRVENAMIQKDDSEQYRSTVIYRAILVRSN